MSNDATLRVFLAEEPLSAKRSVNGGGILLVGDEVCLGKPGSVFGLEGESVRYMKYGRSMRRASSR